MSELRNNDELNKKESAEEQTDTRTRAQRVRSVLIEAAVYILLAVICIFVVPKYVIGRVSVEGPSMQDTLYDGDQLLGEKLSKLDGKLDRFDIIFFYPLGDRTQETFIKRIIGLPNETVQIIDKVIYINGAPLSESFGREDMINSGLASEPITLAEDEYFVLGDNRNNSTDSRSKRVGNVKLDTIEGCAVFRLWPLSGFGTLD